MALITADRVREFTSTNGTGTLTLTGAAVGYQTFSSAIGNGNTCYYAIYNPGVNEWEVGIGTVGAGTLARTTVLASSNAGSLVSFSAGTKDVFVTYPAEYAVFQGGSFSGTTVTGTRVNITGQGDLRLEDTTGGEYVALQAPATLTASYTLTMPVDDGTNGQALITDGNGNLSWSTAASGDVYGPASATSTAVALFDGATGKLLKNSGVTVDGSNNVSGVAQLNATTVDLTNLEVTNIKAKDGTASITLANSTGVATFAANPSINAGTANGVAYLNGSKVLTTGSALTFDGTNLGVGVTTPSTYSAKLAVLSSATSPTIAYVSGSGVSNTNTLSTDYWLPNSFTGLDKAAIFGVINPSATANNYGQFYWSLASAGAATEQMRLTSTGLGIGTSSPVSKCTVAADSVDGSQLRVVGATNQNYQIRVGFDTTNLLGKIQAIHAGTAYKDLVLQPDGGNLLVGTTSGSGERLSVNFTGTQGIRLNTTSTNATLAVQFVYNGSNEVGKISTTTTSTAYNTSSDYRLKENIQPMQNALEVVQQLNPVTYTWKADGSDGQGFIAHELQAVVPDCVTGEKDAVDEEGKPVYQGIDTSFLVATLTKAIQEQQEQINELKAEVAALKGA